MDRYDVGGKGDSLVPAHQLICLDSSSLVVTQSGIMGELVDDSFVIGM